MQITFKELAELISAFPEELQNMPILIPPTDDWRNRHSIESTPILLQFPLYVEDRKTVKPDFSSTKKKNFPSNVVSFPNRFQSNIEEPTDDGPSVA
jgi:hypothetical protein